nr:hypothetical protein [uncultured Holophaga sp.]
MGDFEDFILRGCGLEAGSARAVRVFAGEALPDPADFSGVIITGSHAMVTDREPWCLRLAHWLRHVCADRLPTLGICFGHQALGERTWGVQFHPEFTAELVNAYIGEQELALTEDGLDPEALRRSVREHPWGGVLLQRFVQLAGEKSRGPRMRTDPHG